MAIYHFSTKIISRAKGQSAVACAAYRTADKLYDERYGKVQDYTKKEDVLYAKILLPECAPAWMRDREKLWNHVEKIEIRKDARLAREFEIALPRELTREQNIALIKEFVNEKFVSKGLVVDMGLHDGVASDGGKQPHVHLMVIERDVTKDGFGKKYRELNKAETLYALRKDFASVTNKHLALNGFDIQVDHRSLKEQGIDLIPQKKIGATGFFHRMASYQEHQENSRLNGERLLANPEIVLSVLTNQQSTFTHHDIARIVNRYTADSEQFLSVYEKVKVSPSLVPLGKDDKYQERFTTKEMVQLESEMMANTSLLIEKNGHAVNGDSIEKISMKHGLSPEQNTAFKYLIDKGDLKNVIGYAGTGKSRLLGAAREAWEISGYRVLGATLSGIAAENLESSSDISSRTLASRLLAWEQGRDLLTSNDVLVIDEAGMLGTRQLTEVTVEANKRGAKLVLTGDPQEQLQAIEAGAAFRGIIHHTSSKIELKEIWRQHESWQKEATVLFSTRQTADAIDQYLANDCIHEYETQANAKQALVDGWNDARISQPEKTQIMLAFKRDDVRELNEAARELRQSLGELGNDHLFETNRGIKQFAEGDKVYFLRNDKELGVKNGTLGTVVGIDNDSLFVQLSNNAKENPSTIQVSMDRYNHIDYGYASTIHKGQGGTYDRSFVLASKYLDRHSINVAMTRHRDGAELFWSKEEFASYQDMVKSFSRDGSKDSVYDYIGRELEKASFALHRGLDTLWDTFWEKYGKEWLEKIQQTFVGWTDGAKELVDKVKEQTAKTLGILDKDEESWLKETNAWIEKMFGKNEHTSRGELSKENNDHQISEQKSNSTSLDKNVKPLTDDERYQNIIKDAEKWPASLNADSFLKKNELTHSSTEKIEKGVEKTLDKEMDF